MRGAAAPARPPRCPGAPSVLRTSQGPRPGPGRERGQPAEDGARGWARAGRQSPGGAARSSTGGGAAAPQVGRQPRLSSAGPRPPHPARPRGDPDRRPPPGLGARTCGGPDAPMAGPGAHEGRGGLSASRRPPSAPAAPPGETRGSGAREGPARRRPRAEQPRPPDPNPPLTPRPVRHGARPRPRPASGPATASADVAQPGRTGTPPLPLCPPTSGRLPD